MNIYIFDYEVFAYDWILVAKSVETKEYFVFHNDNDGVKDFMEVNDPLLGGFNSKHYDQFIHRGVLAGLTAEEIKIINDYIIVEGHEGWEYPFDGPTLPFNHFDLMDDCQKGLSLKAIEAHLGMDIRETTVPFDIDRPLTQNELDEVICYCKHDVDATEKLYDLRQDYLNTKIHLGKQKGLAPEKALYMTNAKLTALYLDAKPPSEEYKDERDYVYPDNLLREYIPDDVIAFFDRLHNTDYSDEEIFKGVKYTFNIGRCECKIGWGGIHGAIPTYREKATDTRSIRNQDVASYYPHLMTLDGYISRNIPDPSVYAEMLEKRMAAKKAGDKATANALKLVANTTYGGMLNSYNDLYDAKNARSVCITGQLRLLELANHLVAKCPSLVVIQLNTDGIMVSLDDADVASYTEICEEWQHRTGYELEEDCISEIIQKDVNNYIEIATDGSHKIKGGLLVRGIAQAGAFNINNNAVVVARAIVDYFTKGIPAEQTINEDDTLLDFQLVAKASSKYSAVYQWYKGKVRYLQKCNRVYASRDPSYGTLVKIKKEDGSESKVPGLPEHCIIDNNNELSITDIDKGWYIRLAEGYINDFLGLQSTSKQISLIEGETQMATSTAKPKEPEKLNIYQKLAAIRAEWMGEQIKKTGKNTHSEFLYYELVDFLPKATAICAKHNTVFIVTFPEGSRATGTLLDWETNETITFEAPFTYISDPAKFRMNEIQGAGAAVTYYRRYLWFMLLDMIDKDKIDADLPLRPETPSKPATVEEREEITKTLTDPKALIDELQIKGLKNLAKEVIKVSPGQQELITGLLIKTDSFKKTTKAEAENYTALLEGIIADAGYTAE